MEISQHFVKIILVNCQTTVLCGYHFYEAKYKKLGSAKVKATKINLNCRKLTVVTQSSILDATGFLKF